LESYGEDGSESQEADGSDRVLLRPVDAGENGPRDHVSEAQTLLWFNGIDDANWGIQRD